MHRAIIAIVLSTIVAWAGVFAVIFGTSPYEAGVIGVIGLYATLLLALVGTFTLFGYRFRTWATKRRVLMPHLQPAFRQGVLLASVFVGSLWLSHHRLLTWWIAILLVIAVLFLELFFQSRSSHQQRLPKA